jgi:hypothetical protein
MKAQSKFSTAINNADEELAEWIFLNSFSSWKQLYDKVNGLKCQ